MSTHPSPDHAAPAPSLCSTAQLRAIFGRCSSVCVRLGATLSPKSSAELHKFTQLSSPVYCHHLLHQALLEMGLICSVLCSLYSEWHPVFSGPELIHRRWGTRADQSHTCAHLTAKSLLSISFALFPQSWEGKDHYGSSLQGLEKKG